MLHEFEMWLKTKEHLLKSSHVLVEIKRRETPTQAINVILDDRACVASLTVWPTGAFDLDVLSYDTGECLLAKRYDFQNPEEMLKILEDITNRFINHSMNQTI